MDGETMHPGGTLARTEGGCTCIPEQIGPKYRAKSDCPLHGLAAVFGDVDTSGWVKIERDGIMASAPTIEDAEAILNRIAATRRT